MELPIKLVVFYFIKWIMVAEPSYYISAKSAPKSWDYDVYTGRHFNELALPSTSSGDIVKNPIVLMMYGPDCNDLAMEYKTALRPWGPHDKYLTIAMHDYVTYPKHIWYEIDDIDNLYKRYMSGYDGCLKVMFFSSGSRITKPDIYGFHETIYQWAWSKMMLSVKIANAIENKIVVKLEGQGHPRHLVDIDPWDLKEVQVHVSMFITIYDKNDVNLIYYHKVEPPTAWQILTITAEKLEIFQQTKSTEPGWLHLERLQLESESAQRRHDQWHKGEQKLLNFKQPIFLQRFTEKGYKKMKIPEKVYSVLKGFYDDNIPYRMDEASLIRRKNYPLINDNEIPTTVVPLSEGIKQQVFQTLFQLMETWCNCELESTHFYGIREYYKGSTLHNHVDRVETHVISSILQIAQDLDGKPDWDLEVIGFDGKRDYVQLKPGEMLLYESATLIHGRPKPFQGNIFANCFLHYKPRKHWSWQRQQIQGRPMLINGTIQEFVDVINTPTTLKSSNIDQIIDKLNVKTEL